MCNEQDKLYFVERQVANGPDDWEWEDYDSFYTEKEAYQLANLLNVEGHTVRVTHKAKTLHEMAGI